mmetsp:Transcript_60569/g.187663  ORF Transcript_60569/g.187663 Transcript_60569/m.187663 type:complete len:277 (+) Transcript_60569:740-1570(+)
MALARAEISSISFAFFASSSVICAVRLSISSALASREVTAADISLSQKDLVVASAWAWASSLLTRSLMMERTFSKWSAEARIRRAATERMGLRSLPAASSRSAKTLLLRSTSRAPGARRLWLPRSCRKAGTLSFCRPTSMRFAFQFGATPVSSASMAWLMAVSSSERVCERASHSLALSSHCWVRTCMKALSASLAPSSASFSPCASCMRSVFMASSFSFSSFSFSAALFSISKPSFVASKADWASNSSTSRRSFVSVKVTWRAWRVARMSLAWNS